MADTYKPGEIFIYVGGDRWELGMVKAPNNTGDGYFCWYSRGDTAANTPTRCMRKLANAGFTHVEQMLDDDELDWCPFGMSGVARCEADKALKAENDKLRAERDYLLMNSNPTATELRRVRSAWKKDRDENARLRSMRDRWQENDANLREENAKLREQVAQLQDDWESERDYADQMEEVAKKRYEETLLLAMDKRTLKACYDNLSAQHKELKAENAKLRELVRRYGEYTSQDRCEGCVCKARCCDGDVDECWQFTEIRELEHELGAPHAKE